MLLLILRVTLLCDNAAVSLKPVGDFKLIARFVTENILSTSRTCLRIKRIFTAFSKPSLKGELKMACKDKS